MKSLLEHIKNLELQEWQYYTKEGKAINPFLDNSYDTFISNYLSDGWKQSILEKFKFAIGKDREIHTISVFFLGCLFYKNLDFEQLNFKRDDGKDQFYFIWFLSSLIHDYSYEYEKHYCKYKDKFNDIDDFIKYIKIKQGFEHSLFADDSTAQNQEKIFLLHYNIANYFKYRYNEHCKIDHGITAGILLYDSLVSNRLKQKEEQKSNPDNKRYWGNDLDPLYLIASNAIATHNIWKPKDEDTETKTKYIKYGMTNLTDGSIFPISLTDSPFLFLLGLVDTLDPVKTFDCIDPLYVLESILIQFKNQNTIEIKNADDSKLDFSKLIKKVDELDKWLDIEVNICNDSCIKIMIKE
jgi:hypothetical protein